MGMRIWMGLTAAALLAATQGCVVVRTERVVMVEPSYSHVEEQAARDAEAHVSTPPAVAVVRQSGDFNTR